MRRLGMAIGSEKYARGTRRQQLLAEMERVVPWVGLCGRVRTALPQGGGRVPAKDLEMLLRIYCLQFLFQSFGSIVRGRSLRLPRHTPFARHRPVQGAGAGRRPRSAASANCWRAINSARRSSNRCAVTSESRASG